MSNDTAAGNGAKIRVPPVDLDTDDPIVKPIFKAMRERGVVPLHIHRTLANAPLPYQGFSTFATALRGAGATSRADRELAILLTAHLKGSAYEFVQHKRIGESVGLAPKQIDGLNDWRNSDAYSRRQRLILTLTESMVASRAMDEATVAEISRLFSPQEIVELALVSAFYTAVAQFTHAIHIEPETAETTYGEDER